LSTPTPAKSTTPAKKTAAKRGAKDPAAPALAAVKKAEADVKRASERQAKAKAALAKIQQSITTAEDALKRTDAEVAAAERVLEYAKAHPLLAGPTLDEPVADIPEPVVGGEPVPAGTAG
jgi:hypothetical protein